MQKRCATRYFTDVFVFGIAHQEIGTNSFYDRRTHPNEGAAPQRKELKNSQKTQNYSKGKRARNLDETRETREKKMPVLLRARKSLKRDTRTPRG